MKKIGFIDYYLDEWHANNYPKWFREQALKLNLDWDVAYAWADINKDGGLTTAEWCEKQGVTAVSSIEELVTLSDAIVVLSPDHPEQHERLANIALKSGKPVYIDKTFAPNVSSAVSLFSLAETHHTPLFSSSALRFANEVQTFLETSTQEDIDAVLLNGPGQYANYAVHQFEVIVTLLGTEVKRVRGLTTQSTRQLEVEYVSGQRALFYQTEEAPFQAIITTKANSTIHVQQFSDMFLNLITEILLFFETKEVPVQSSETIAVMKLIEAGYRAFEEQDQWIEI